MHIRLPDKHNFFNQFCLQAFLSEQRFPRLAFRIFGFLFLDLRGNLGTVKEKPTRKTCFSREKKRLATRIY